METNQKSQPWKSPGWQRRLGPGSDLITPNPKLKLLDQVREIMRLKHYSIRTERSYCDWIRRYIHYHRMRAREEERAQFVGGMAPPLPSPLLRSRRRGGLISGADYPGWRSRTR